MYPYLHFTVFSIDSHNLSMTSCTVRTCNCILSVPESPCYAAEPMKLQNAWFWNRKSARCTNCTGDFTIQILYPYTEQYTMYMCTPVCIYTYMYVYYSSADTGVWNDGCMKGASAKCRVCCGVQSHSCRWSRMFCTLYKLCIRCTHVYTLSRNSLIGTPLIGDRGKCPD